MDQPAYNTPQLLGNIYNVVANMAGNTEGAEFVTPPMVNKPTLNVSGTPMLTGWATTTIGADGVLKFDPTLGIDTAVSIDTHGVNGGLVTDSFSVMTPNLPQGNTTLPGRAFNYTISVFSIGLGLPYVPGTHVIFFTVGDYASGSVAPQAKTNKGLRELTFDVFGDFTSGPENVWYAGDTNVRVFKPPQEEGSDSNIQLLRFSGWVRKPGIFRFTLAMHSAHESDAANNFTIPGGDDAESFILCVLPFGPQVGDLYVVPGCLKATTAAPRVRIGAIQLVTSDAWSTDFADRWRYVYTHSGVNDLLAEYVDAVWDGAQPYATSAPEQTHVHTRGYWRVRVDFRDPSSDLPNTIQFVISRDKDLWRIYCASTLTDNEAWRVFAGAPLRFFTASPDIEYPPFYFSAGADGCANVCLTGNQCYSVPGLGIFSYTGSINKKDYFAQEPSCGGYPNTADSFAFTNNYLLFKNQNDWVIASTPDDIVDTLGDEPQKQLSPALLYATPRPPQNHGGVVSNDIVFGLTSAGDSDSSAGSGGTTSETVSPPVSISNYANVTQLTLPIFANTRLTWTVKQPKTKTLAVAGYPWIKRYSLLRFINYLNCTVGCSATASYSTVETWTTRTTMSAATGGAEFPTDIAEYVNGGGGVLVYSKGTAESTETTTSKNETRHAGLYNTSGAYASGIPAWTGYDGFFKVVGWSPYPGSSGRLGSSIASSSWRMRSTSNSSNTNTALIAAGGVQIVYTSALYTTKREVRLDALPNWVEGAGIAAGATTVVTDSKTQVCTYTPYTSGTDNCVCKNISTIVELTEPHWVEPSGCTIAPDAVTGYMSWWFEGGGLDPDFGSESSDGPSISLDGLTWSAYTAGCVCYLSVSYDKGACGGVVRKVQSVPFASGGVTLQFSDSYDCDPSPGNLESQTGIARVTAHFAGDVASGGYWDPKQSAVSHTETTDLDCQWFASRWNAEISGCELVATIFGNPPAAASKPITVTGDAGTEVTVTSNGSGGDTFRALASAAPYTPAVTGPTIAKGFIQLPSSSGGSESDPCGEYAYAVTYVESETVTETSISGTTAGTAGLHADRNDANNSWFSLNAQLWDYTENPNSGGRLLYATAAGRGHTQVYVPGAPRVQMVVTSSVETTKHTRTLTSGGAGYAIVTTSETTSSGGQYTIDFGIHGAAPCTFYCNGGLMSGGYASMTSAPLLFHGDAKHIYSNYTGFAQLLGGGEAEQVVIDGVSAGYSASSDTFTYVGGRDTDTDSGGISGGYIDDEPISGGAASGGFARAHAAVADIEEDLEVEGSWVNSGGRIITITDVRSYFREDHEIDSGNNTSLTLSLSLAKQ